MYYKCEISLVWFPHDFNALGSMKRNICISIMTQPVAEMIGQVVDGPSGNSETSVKA